MRSAERAVLSALTVSAGLLLSGVALSAPATAAPDRTPAQVPAVSSAFVTQVPAAAPVKKTKACVKASRTLVRANARLAQVRRSHSPSGLKAAWRAQSRALLAKQTACRPGALVTPAVVTPAAVVHGPTQAQLRPGDDAWVAPGFGAMNTGIFTGTGAGMYPVTKVEAVGSGLARSNAIANTIVNDGCPVTVPTVAIVRNDLDAGPGVDIGYAADAHVTNLSVQYLQVHVVVDFAHPDGSPARNGGVLHFTGFEYTVPDRALFDMTGYMGPLESTADPLAEGSVWRQYTGDSFINEGNWNTLHPVTVTVTCLPIATRDPENMSTGTA